MIPKLSSWKNKILSQSNEWGPNALQLAQSRFLVEGPIHTIDSWFEQVARSVGDEKWSDAYAALLKSRSFLPTSSALVNTVSQKGSLAGCVVLPLKNDLDHIFQHSLPQIFQVLQRGTGVGIDLGILSPRLTPHHDGRACPGPVEILSSIVSAVHGPTTYNGVKRSAFMATLPLAHPDIFEFISCKSKRKLENVNISVTLNQVAVEAIQRKGLIPITFNREIINTQTIYALEKKALERATPLPDLYLLSDQVYSRTAQKAVGQVIGDDLYFSCEVLIDYIAFFSHQCGDPGIINLAEINRTNPTLSQVENKLGQGPIRVTTPCGEQPLLPYEVCHLGSFNLNRFVVDGMFDEDLLKQTVHIATRFMDDLVEQSQSHIPESNRVTQDNRKIGLGLMGLADVLAELEYIYDSEEGRSFAARVMQLIQESAAEASQELAQERGAFKNFPMSVFHQPRRHATLTTIAPTGHISTLADCSTAIEPYYLLSYQRQANGKKIFNCPTLDHKLAELGFSLDQWIKLTRKENPHYHFDGTLAGLTLKTGNLFRDKRLKKLKSIFKTAHEISPNAHLKMVSALQDHVENGISKTINLPQSSSLAEVKSLILQSLKSGLKGVTVFRDGCLSEQALSGPKGCDQCGEIIYLRPSDCAGYFCDSEKGGCGYEVCNL